jgi:small-conductance mechanosensitive channel
LKSRLGSALVSVVVTDPDFAVTDRQAKFTEAEALLLEGNEAVQQSSSADRKYKRDVLQRLMRLYEAWEKPDQAAKWRSKLESFEQTAAEKNSAPTQGAPE